MESYAHQKRNKWHASKFCHDFPSSINQTLNWLEKNIYHVRQAIHLGQHEK